MEVDLHNSRGCFERGKENLGKFKNGKIAIACLEAMITCEISISRVSTLAWNVRTILVWNDNKPVSE